MFYKAHWSLVFIPVFCFLLLSFSFLVKGLAYVDFSDDAHLAAALEKNKQIFLGKKLSILKSDPQQGSRKGVAGHSIRSEHGKLIY